MALKPSRFLDPKVEQMFKSDALKRQERARQEGEQRGLERGRAQGIQEGEQKAKKELAQKLLASGMDRDKVMALMGSNVF